jgi:16S rRNA (cytosine967-C5)-methyltransferase
MAAQKKSPPADAVRDIVLETLAKVRQKGGFASAHIADAFHKRERLGQRARKMAAETTYGIISQKRRLEHALQGAFDGTRSSDMLRLTAFRVLHGEWTVEQARRAVPRVDWAYVAKVNARIDQEKDPVLQLALRHSFPDWLAKKLIEQHGPAAATLAAALNQRPPQTLRVNTLRTTREAFLKELADAGIDAHPGALSPAAVIIDTPVNVFKLAGFGAGHFELQDEASQIVAELVAPPSGATVLDACAGAGGKTLALAALMKGRGVLAAYDPDHKKLAQLALRARRAQAHNLLPLKQMRDAPPEFYDRVLVDAPCSGIGALRRKPEARWRIQEADLAPLAAQQEQIARRAMRAVKPGGRLIYATCTILAEENEQVVERLAADGDFEIMPIGEILGLERAAPLNDPSGRFLKTLPHRHNTDGFFAAVLRRGAS